MAESIVVGAIVAAAVVAVVVWSIRSLRGESSCGSCAQAGQCPFAKGGKCPSDEADEPHAALHQQATKPPRRDKPGNLV